MGNANDRYKPSKQIGFKTSLIQSDLPNHKDPYIVVKGAITVKTRNNRAIDGYNINLILKDDSPFTSCISKINNMLVDNTEDFDDV